MSNAALAGVTTATATEPRTVKLPCCEKCGLVGLQPESAYHGKLHRYCVGPREAPHKKAKMRPVVFREDLDG